MFDGQITLGRYKSDVYHVNVLTILINLIVKGLEATECFKCDSNEIRQCLDPTGFDLPTEQCPSNQMCYSFFEAKQLGTFVNRGCYDEAEKNEVFTCTNDLCNRNKDPSPQVEILWTLHMNLKKLLQGKKRKLTCLFCEYRAIGRQDKSNLDCLNLPQNKLQSFAKLCQPGEICRTESTRNGSSVTRGCTGVIDDRLTLRCDTTLCNYHITGLNSYSYIYVPINQPTFVTSKFLIMTALVLVVIIVISCLFWRSYKHGDLQCGRSPGVRRVTRRIPPPLYQTQYDGPGPPYGGQPGGPIPYPHQEHTYPPQEHTYPPQQHTYPPQEHTYPPQQHTYPPQGNSYPRQEHTYPPQGNSYLPQEHTYPPQGPSNPPRPQQTDVPQQQTNATQQHMNPPQENTTDPHRHTYPPYSG